ncbi:hypothetical protein BATDEDRAFT_20019 [Batrachochytrium dendrobatidis JAM81]|uniref:Adenosine deaminase domain-containing protein n=1 Tax=Batrachochytrium dendrobatidis (strain JAM81 / FGSC 10211) TaxID=684364 RepID=F4P626_BATDJ|nr:uncharacterized protein BATDEDRAFT_20019 [Batrachochytrium dendrobatidis JAM81]EGF79528.1 hypothetical protein BATDEDRAFT_20019 [Batrachochytrium dendrobatidis JAM81]KAK5665763.1 hypothetical protein QVD99_007398 [Batrachochytrium dendrobatidis]|eukprot:XP_006679837.1 hypothetical protein BATDEDRAFT_20019 [Batrachochytrium dendrobatidis JAM81]
MTALKPCDMVAFCKRMPKIELHAHLNGSVSRETIRHLISMQPSNATLQADFATFEKQCSLTSIHSFFPLFKFVYAVSNCIANVRYITRQVIVEFSTDGCEYLELRSTPRSNPETDLVSKRTYIEACLAGTKDAIEMLKGAIQVRWILSLDRRHSLEDGLETVQLAKEFMDQGVVGVDLCGEPSAGNFKDLEPAFIQAREAGLKVTLHVAEIKNHEQETRDMIHFMPDRIGHGTFLKDALREHVVDNAIPIEACVTSNLLCKTVERIEDHHFNGFYFEGHPCIPCTDDKGVFQCTLSSEYSLIANHFNMSKLDVITMVQLGIDHIFANEETKEQLRAKVLKFKLDEKV